MAKNKQELLNEAVASGRVSEDANPDDFTAAQLEGIVSGDVSVPGREMLDQPQVAPDGHVNLSQEDIDNRA